MLLQRGLKVSLCVWSAITLLSGCSSTVFPDFEDDSDIIISDGGQVEIRKVEASGVLVADKDNAAYEDEEDKGITIEKAEKAEPARVVEVKKEEIEPAKDNVKVVESKAQPFPSESEAAPAMPSMHYLAATVYFENGGAAVDASYNRNLRKIARLAKENNAVVTVYGFASSRTRDTDPATHKLINFKVSASRAENTARALRRAGVPADKIIVRAMSDSMPMYQEVMPEGERLNRRAEIYLTY